MVFWHFEKHNYSICIDLLILGRGNRCLGDPKSCTKYQDSIGKPGFADGALTEWPTTIRRPEMMEVQRGQLG